MMKRYVVRLAREGRAVAYRRWHAPVLLRVDQGEKGPGHLDRVEIAHRTQNLRNQEIRTPKRPCA